MLTPLESQYDVRMTGKLFLIYTCNLHVLSYLLLIYICKLHWNVRVSILGTGHIVFNVFSQSVIAGNSFLGQVSKNSFRTPFPVMIYLFYNNSI